MTFPITNPVVFPQGTGNLTVTSVNLLPAPGSPAGQVIDLDSGFVVSGTGQRARLASGGGTAKGEVSVWGSGMISQPAQALDREYKWEMGRVWGDSRGRQRLCT